MAVCEKMMLLLPLLHWYVGVLLLAFIVQEWLRGGLGVAFGRIQMLHLMHMILMDMETEEERSGSEIWLVELAVLCCVHSPFPPSNI